MVYVAPGPNSFKGASGQAGLTWFHLVIWPCAAGSQSFFSSSTVACLRKAFFGLMTTVSASKATGISMYSTPAALQSSISLAVIGREAFRVSREDALDHVAGYTIVNDITTRDLVFRKDMKEIGTDWYRAKNAPGFLPTGPLLVPARFVDPADTPVRLELNGEVMQDANTSDLLFDVPALISAASQTHPLLPGDLLLTGSPAGNGQHWKRFLRDGDVVEWRFNV